MVSLDLPWNHIHLAYSLFWASTQTVESRKKPKIKTVGMVISPSVLLLGNEKLLINGKVSGSIRSFARSKWLNKTIAIAHVDLKYASEGQEFSVGYDDFSTRKKIVAKICSRRFYNQLM